MSDKTTYFSQEMPTIPSGFGMENEHPTLTMPFNLKLGDDVFEGKRISVTQIEVKATGAGRLREGMRGLATLQFQFEGFAVTMMADVTAVPGGDSETTGLLFTDPTGAHLAQLRYIMNSYIAGDLVTLKGMVGYTGPTQPKAHKEPDAKATFRDRTLSIMVVLTSLVIAFLAATVVFERYTTAYEMYPVFIDQAGLTMQATVAGQLTFLDKDADVGGVAYTVASNTGEVLSFQMPRSGKVTIASEIFEGATVLSEDLILTISNDSPELRLRAMISIDGLTRALGGDHTHIELNDGRVLPVEVLVRDTTRTSVLKGDLFVPVDLAVKGEGLDPSDINKSARLRLSKSLRGIFGFEQEN